MSDYTRSKIKRDLIDALKGKTSGFTLIELLIAIAVFAALSVVAIPSIRGLVDNISGNRATHEIISDLHATRMLAIRHGQNSSLQINEPAPGQYKVSWTDSTGVRSRVVDLTSFRHGVRFENNPPDKGGPSPDPVTTITFSPRGFTSLNPQGWGNVYLTDQDGTEVIRIQVAFSGAISEMRWIPASHQWIYK